MTDAYLLTGSNIGRRREMLRKAEELIEERIGQVLKKSALYETAPWGNTAQDYFLNQVLVCQTSLSASEVLESILEIEKLLGRVRKEKWGPRTIDIDILYFGNEIIDHELLRVPHPELHRRRFTLTPLVDIAPEFVHPALNKTQRALLQDCPDTSKVAPVEV